MTEGDTKHRVRIGNTYMYPATKDETDREYAWILEQDEARYLIYAVDGNGEPAEIVVKDLTWL